MKKNYQKIAFERRLDVLKLIFKSQAGHIGGDMSSMDILVSLYYRVMNTRKILEGSDDRDRFILSKGHNAEALYTILADIGFFPESMLDTYAKLDTILAQHPTKMIPGVEVATGSLGHGLSLGVGMALGLAMKRPTPHVYVLMGDGEQAEGSVWEAAMAAAKYELDGLTAIIDRNGMQISGTTETVMPLDDLGEKYRAFGWHTVECNGHNSDALTQALRLRVPRKPVCVIAHTHKGYGCTLMQDRAEWHHKVPNEDQYRQIFRELQSAIEQEGGKMHG